MTPESRAIREAELITLDPRTAHQIRYDYYVKNSRCPECGGRGEVKMDAFPSLVCVDCRGMYDPREQEIY